MQWYRRISILVLILSTFYPSQTVLSQINQNLNIINPDQEVLAPHLMALTLIPGSPTDSKPDSTVLSQQSGKEKEFLNGKNVRIINLGKIVNSRGLDYAPSISADGKTLYFVSNRPGSIEDEKGIPSHDIWATKKNDKAYTEFQPPYNIDSLTVKKFGERGFNTSLNEGAGSISADGQTFYFTGCNRPDGFGDCDIYKTTIIGGLWSKPVNLGNNVNSKCWDSQPSIDPYNNRIYFTSNRDPKNPKGECLKNNFDIWYSDWDSDQKIWKPAQNLKAINTSKKEVSPFIASDGVTLFFASDGYPDIYGGLDFYVTEYNPETNSWTEPHNLGEPINTKDDEQFMSMPASGDIIYFSSRRTDLPGYSGDFDLFMATVPTMFRTLLLRVSAVDDSTGDNIPAAITIKNPITGRFVKDSTDITRTDIEIPVSNFDYGNPKNKLSSVDFVIISENPNYEQTTIVEEINKPTQSSEGELTNKNDFIHYVTIRMKKK